MNLPVRGDWNPFLRWPAVSLALAGLLCLPLLLRLPGFRVGAETEALLGGDQRSLAVYQQVREILGETDALAISVTPADVFSPEGLALVRRISDAFEQQPDVIEVKSLTHSVRPVRRGRSFTMVPFVPAEPLDAAGLAALRGFCLAHPLVRNLIVSADGRHTLVTVQFDGQARTPEAEQEFRQRVEATLAPFRAEGVGLQVLARPLIEDEIRTTLRRDLRCFLPAALAVLVAALWRTFRSWRLVIFTLLNQVLVLALLPGIAQLTKFELNVFSIALAPLVTGIHLTLLMHLLTAVQRGYAETRAGGARLLPSHPIEDPDPARQQPRSTGSTAAEQVPGVPIAQEPNDPRTRPSALRGMAGDAALRSALGIVARPAFLATLTTVLALLSLGTSGIPHVRGFGWLGALCLATVHAMTFGPVVALLKLGGRWLGLATQPPTRSTSSPAPARSGGEGRGEGGRLPNHWVAFITRRRTPILVGASIAALVAVGGLAQLRTDVRVIEMLNSRSPTRQALQQLDRAYGGINFVQIAFDSGRTNGVQDPRFLRYLDDVQRFATAQPEPTGVLSYAGLLAIVNQIWEGGGAEALRLPDNPLLFALFSTAIRAYRFPFIAALADAEFREAQLVVRTRDMPAREYLALIERIVAYAEAQKPAGVTISAARGMHSILEADRQILRSQFVSAGLALLVIAITLGVAWRSVGLALLAVVTNLVPVALTLAAAGYAQVPLNSFNVMVGALALGIAQDDTVHFVTYWRRRRAAGDPASEALRRTFEVKGRPIVWTTVVLVAVLGLFGLSSFPPVVQFGLLLAGAFVAAQLSLLLCVPAVLVNRQAASAVSAPR